MKNALVADSSFGTWPAPFCDFPSGPAGTRGGPGTTAREWSPRVRIAVGLTVMVVLMAFVGLTSLLQFGAFNRTANVANAANEPRTVTVSKESDAAPASRRTAAFDDASAEPAGGSPAKQVPEFATQGDRK